jgi:hypothetical protein
MASNNESDNTHDATSGKGVIDATIAQDRGHLEMIAAFYASGGFMQHAQEINKMLRSIDRRNGRESHS